MLLINIRGTRTLRDCVILDVT